MLLSNGVNVKSDCFDGITPLIVGEELPAEVVRDYYHLLCFANCALVEKTSDSESPESSESPSEGSESPSEGSVDAEVTTAVGLVSNRYLYHHA